MQSIYLNLGTFPGLFFMFSTLPPYLQCFVRGLLLLPHARNWPIVHFPTLHHVIDRTYNGYSTEHGNAPVHSLAVQEVSLLISPHKAQ